MKYFWGCAVFLLLGLVGNISALSANTTKTGRFAFGKKSITGFVSVTSKDRQLLSIPLHLFDTTSNGVKTDTTPDIFSKQNPASDTAAKDTTSAPKIQNLHPENEDSSSFKSKQITGKDTAATNNTRFPKIGELSSEPSHKNLKDVFLRYKKFSKSTNINSTTSLSILQQDVSYKTKTDFTTEYDLQNHLSNTFDFNVFVKSLNTEVETMGVQLQYNSNEKKDSTSTFAKPLFDIVGKKSYLSVDSTGKILSVDTSETGKKINTVLAGLSLSGGDFELGSNFGLMVKKDLDSLSLGTTWIDSVQNGQNKRVTIYKVQNILTNEIVVLISGTIEQSGIIQSDGASFKTHFLGSQMGKIRVEKATGLIEQRDLHLQLKGNVDYQDKQFPATAVSTIKEIINPI